MEKFLARQTTFDGLNLMEYTKGKETMLFGDFMRNERCREIENESTRWSRVPSTCHMEFIPGTTRTSMETGNFYGFYSFYDSVEH